MKRGGGGGEEKLLNEYGAVRMLPPRCRASFWRAFYVPARGMFGVKAGESTGEGDRQGEEELECFDAMQTDSTGARR